MRYEITKRNLISFSLLTLFLYFLPFILFGKDTYVLIHDNLDSNLSWFKVLKDQNLLFSYPEANIGVFGYEGMPRKIFPSPLSFFCVLFHLFSPFQAYAINFLLMHLIAFIGMYLFLKRHFLPSAPDYINILTSLCFALLPFWPFGALSVAGIPLALFSFLNIKKREDKFYDWLIIFLLPFYSSLVMSFFAVITLLGLYWVYELVKYKKTNLRFIITLFIFFFIYLLSEYQLVYNTFFDQFISHRSTFETKTINFLEGLKLTLTTIKMNQYHFHSLNSYSIFYSMLSLMLLILLKKVKFKEIDKRIFYLLFGVFSTSLIYGFWNWDIFYLIREKVSLLKEFKFSRVISFNPFFWFLIFALCLKHIHHSLKNRAIYLIFPLFLFQLMISFYFSDYIQEFRKNKISYREFFSEDLFLEIETFIDKPQNEYRVGSIGIHPSISQYNGFYTIDFYLPYYPLHYKYQFRKVISEELDKNINLKKYYDNWGSRAYLFTDVLEKDMLSKKEDLEINDLKFNIKELKKMNVQYIFSRIPINNQFKFLKKFKNPDSFWDIYLYQVE